MRRAGGRSCDQLDILVGYPPFGRDFLLVPTEGNGLFGPGVCLASLGKLSRPSGGNSCRVCLASLGKLSHNVLDTFLSKLINKVKRFYIIYELNFFAFSKKI